MLKSGLSSLGNGNLPSGNQLEGHLQMKLHRDLGVTQKTAWFLAHRIRETWRDSFDWLLPGPVEVDETLHWRQT